MSDSDDFKLHHYKGLPEGFFTHEPQNFYEVFPGPSLIEIQGKMDPPIFITALLHGNETTAVLALQKLLENYQQEELPRSLLILVGNVKAAREKVRRLDDQEDYNRIWSDGSSDGQRFAQEVFTIAKEKNIFLNIDIHNNTGNSPHYSCICELKEEFVNIARLFSDTMVYFKRPKEVQSTYFSQLCPSVTLESGKVGDPAAVFRVVNFLEICLSLNSIPNQRHHEGLKTYHSVAGVLVPQGHTIDFSDEKTDADFTLPQNFDFWNFVDLPENSLLGHRKGNAEFIVVDEKSNNVSDQFIKYIGDEIRLKREIVPAMLTQDQRVIVQDCLGYFMQRYSLD